MTANGQDVPEASAEDPAVVGLDGVRPGRIADKEALLSGSTFGLVDVPLPGFGSVRVRPLTRAEAMEIYDRPMSAAEMEQAVVSMACREPTFTRGEVARWQAHSAAGGPLFTLVNRILAISGMEVGTGKAAYQRFRGPA